MKVNAITLRSGNVIEYNGKLCVVVKNEISSPGKGASVAQVEMRDIRTGNKDNVRFRTQETVERVRLEQTEYQFLYYEGDDIVLMNNETYEQITVTKEQMGPQAAYLQDNMIIEVETLKESLWDLLCRAVLSWKLLRPSLLLKDKPPQHHISRPFLIMAKRSWSLPILNRDQKLS